MTDQELKDLVASLAIAQRETGLHIAELRKAQQETGLHIAELRQAQQETGLHIAELRQAQQETGLHIAELRQAQQETGLHIAELRQAQQETDRQLKETDRQLKETDRQLRQQIKELGKQIGGLGEKFGGFTEGMAFPSMSKILTEQLGMEVITPRVKVKKGGETLELDVLAYANSDRNVVHVVEVKSHLRPEGIEQLRKILQRFRLFFPEHGDKKLYGILAVVDAPEELRKEALAEGFYLAGIHDEQFVMETPSGFVPKGW